jgi:hypothetical protein
MIQSYIGAVLRSFSQEALEARDVSIRMLQWMENYKFKKFYRAGPVNVGSVSFGRFDWSFHPYVKPKSWA